jgi:hypothetical protein
LRRKLLKGKRSDMGMLREKQSARLRSVIPGTTLEYIGQLFFGPPEAQLLIYLKMSATCFSPAFEKPRLGRGFKACPSVETQLP